MRELAIDALVLAGGDGTMAIAARLMEQGVRCVGIPKTIDGDVAGTEQTCGLDTAVETATHAVDSLHSTAEAHQRVIVVEVMGRNAGFVALRSGIAGGADVVLIPEVPCAGSVRSHGDAARWRRRLDADRRRWVHAGSGRS
jgi:6-phosphofructokinase